MSFINMYHLSDLMLYILCVPAVWLLGQPCVVLFYVLSCISLEMGELDAWGVGSDSFCPVRW